jgi:hypothetical protein
MTDPLPIEPSRQLLWRRLQWGAQMGLVFAFALIAFAGLQYLLNGAGVRAKYGIGFLTIAALYVVACIVGGVLVGLLLPLTKTKVGSGFVGFVAFVPSAIVMHYPGLSDLEWTRLDVVAAFLGALFLGVPLGLYYNERVFATAGRKQRKRHRKE